MNLATGSRSNLRIAMLVTEAHGGLGGISQYNIDVLDALAESDQIEEIVVLPRLVKSLGFVVPPKINYDLRCSKSLTNFLSICALHSFSGSRFDLVYCAHINLMPMAVMIARMHRAPIVLSIFGIDAWQRPKSRFAAMTARAPNLVISISKVTLNRFRRWTDLNGTTTAIVPNAIRLQAYGAGEKNLDLIARFGLAGRKVIMTFGRMSSAERYKGFDEVISLLPRLKSLQDDIVYLIAGEGDDRKRLEAKADQLGVAESVVFTGHVPEGEKADYYRLADAFVMPSSGEGFGFVILEALACGIPVVASSADGTFEAVKGGALGIVVDPTDPLALEQGILEALRRPKVVPSDLDYFSFERFSDRLLDALSSVLADSLGRAYCPNEL